MSPSSATALVTVRQLVLALLLGVLVLSAFSAPAVAAPSWPGMKKCGSFQAEYRIHVYANKRLRCGTARRVMRAFWGPARGRRSHSDGSVTLRRYPGWRCHSGSGGGGCRKGKKFAGYQN